MSKLRIRSTAKAILLPTILFLCASAGAAIPITELTAEQYKRLTDEQLISAGESQITLGELRAQQAARRAAHKAGTPAARAWAKKEFETLRVELAAREEERSKATRERVKALIAYFKRLTAINPEMVRRARAFSAQRRAVHELWIQSFKASTAAERKRIEAKLKKIQKKLKRIQRTLEPPSG